MFQTFILSLVQSLTEFLPVSSSGHLILMRFFMHWNMPSLMTDIGLHIGTLLAVCVYFYKDIIGLFRALFFKKESKKLLCNLIIATIPVPFFVLLFISDLKQLRTPDIIAFMLIIFGIALWLADKYSPSHTEKQIAPWHALAIGIAQCFALIPGVSRSGITITVARLCGIDRTKAAHFSMLLSIPTIFFAGVWAVFKCLQNDSLCTFSILSFYGILYAFIFGLIVISVFMKFVKKNSFALFMVYRVLLGLAVFLYMWHN